MSLTRESLHRLHDERARSVGLPAGRRPPGLGRWLAEPGAVGRRWPRRLGLAWVAVLVGATLLEPAPADPDAAAPLWASVLFLALFAVLGVMAASLARRRRLGLVASAGAAGLGLLASALCPVSDHHSAVGAWWYLQMGGFTALVAASVAGLRRSRAAA